MSINIKNYGFQGPFGRTSGLEPWSGVYAVLGRNSLLDPWILVDIGESHDVQYRVENHDRKSCWHRQNYSILGCAAYYCDKNSREHIEKELRQKYDLPCGKK